MLALPFLRSLRQVSPHCHCSPGDSTCANPGTGQAGRQASFSPPALPEALELPMASLSQGQEGRLPGLSCHAAQRPVPLPLAVVGSPERASGAPWQPHAAGVAPLSPPCSASVDGPFLSEGRPLSAPAAPSLPQMLGHQPSGPKGNVIAPAAPGFCAICLKFPVFSGRGSWYWTESPRTRSLCDPKMQGANTSSR